MIPRYAHARSEQMVTTSPAGTHQYFFFCTGFSETVWTGFRTGSGAGFSWRNLRLFLYIHVAPTIPGIISQATAGSPPSAIRIPASTGPIAYPILPLVVKIEL